MSSSGLTPPKKRIRFSLKTGRGGPARWVDSLMSGSWILLIEADLEHSGVIFRIV